MESAQARKVSSVMSYYKNTLGDEQDLCEASLQPVMTCTLKEI